MANYRQPLGANARFHGDHLGSSRTMTNYNGYPLWSASHRPFGEETSPSSLTTSHYLFTGLERDAESGLDHTWFRQYSSAQGRVGQLLGSLSILFRFTSERFGRVAKASGIARRFNPS